MRSALAVSNNEFHRINQINQINQRKKEQNR